MEHYDILIVGAGAAGISAAKAINGCTVLLVDSAEAWGGILPQCIHRGFGDEYSGAAYTEMLLRDFPPSVSVRLGTTVLEITADRTARLSDGSTIRFTRLIWAAGCREIPMGALPIAGTRPKGIYTAGQMQALMNLHGYIPTGPAVILGSGDLGLIMAEQLAQAGLTVTLVEQKPHCGGLPKNRRRIERPEITLRCGVTVMEVSGSPALETVILSDGTALPCRNLLIAVGLMPERELINHVADAPWLHLCGNCRTVHPRVETVVYEGTQAGLAACRKIRGVL